MNYRHSFHAGNFADCLKHIVLVQIIKLMQKKDKPFMVLDAFSGTGIYDLHQEFAARSPEYLDGIVKIWDFKPQEKLAPAIKDYLNALSLVSPSQRYYAGSPFIIARLLRAQDKAFFNELHKIEYENLKSNIYDFWKSCECRNLHVENDDGYQAIKAKLPPQEKRGLIFIDPPFEKPNEFKMMYEACAIGVKKFKTGVFALWFADKNATDTEKFLKNIKSLNDKYLIVSMQTEKINNNKGLVSSGLIIINPPYGLYQSLKDCMGQLTKIMMKNEGAKFRLEQSESI